MGKIVCILASMCAGIVVSVLVPGCGGTRGVPESAAVAEAGKKFLASDEPADAMDVIKVRELLEASNAPKELVIVGRVDGLGQPTWETDRAAFLIADQSLQKDDSDHDGAPKHDADNCPYCSKRKKQELAGTAIVEIVDADGTVPQQNARELLGLGEGQTIVVSGKAELDKLGRLVVRTNTVFVKK